MRTTTTTAATTNDDHDHHYRDHDHETTTTTPEVWEMNDYDHDLDDNRDHHDHDDHDDYDQRPNGGITDTCRTTILDRLRGARRRWSGTAIQNRSTSPTVVFRTGW